ncbi:MAG: formate dehydrogenase accessory sulfurtransferase FdhD [Pseudoxanthomonas suwonensis]|nr:formate dehydrogenase accessory sulfurtransferase FdhD [Pseudoxanthomonas suwonensis]
MSGGGLCVLAAEHIDGSGRAPRDESVVVETPVALLYNGDPFAVMMATPCDLADFALGFALAEGVVASADELALVDMVPGEHGVALHCAIPQARFDALGERRRNLEGRSGCGLCGTESLQAAVRAIAPVGNAVRDWMRRELLDALERLDRAQPLNAASGGVHAAGLLHAGGLLVREDVGRHNAVDKAIGAALGTGVDAAGCALLVTSRASFEIVQKAASVGIGTVVAISAPTSLAVQRANALGIALAAFARRDGMNLYSHAARVR